VTASGTTRFCSPASGPDGLVQPELSRLLDVFKRTGPDTGFHDPRRTCARMGFVKGQHPKRALEFLGHPNVAFAPDERIRFRPGPGADNVMEGAPSGAPAHAAATAAPLLPSPPSGDARISSIRDR